MIKCLFTLHFPWSCSKDYMEGIFASLNQSAVIYIWTTVLSNNNRKVFVMTLYAWFDLKVIWLKTFIKMFDVSISSHIRNTLTLSFLAMFFLTVLGRGLRGYLASWWNAGISPGISYFKYSMEGFRARVFRCRYFCSRLRAFEIPSSPDPTLICSTFFCH